MLGNGVGEFNKQTCNIVSEIGKDERKKDEIDRWANAVLISEEKAGTIFGNRTGHINVHPEIDPNWEILGIPDNNGNTEFIVNFEKNAADEKSRYVQHRVGVGYERRFYVRFPFRSKNGVDFELGEPEVYCP